MMRQENTISPTACTYLLPTFFLGNLALDILNHPVLPASHFLVCLRTIIGDVLDAYLVSVLLGVYGEVLY